jgi:hypothetical protein
MPCPLDAIKFSSNCKSVTLCASIRIPGPFEEFLLSYPVKGEASESADAVSAVASGVLEEYRLTHSMRQFRDCLEKGAPSDDGKDEALRERPSS